MAKKRNSKKRLNAELIRKAKEAVLKSQDASYKFLKTTLGVGSMGMLKRILQNLSRLGVVAQTTGRRWVVTMSPDGTKRERPPAPKRKKARRKRRSKAKTSASAPSAKPQAPKGDVTTEAKLQKLQQLVKAAGPETSRILTAVISDVKAGDQSRKVQDVLN